MHRYRQIAENKRLSRYIDVKSSGILDHKIDECRKLMESCCLCERRCGINRLAGEVGFCGVGEQCRISLEQILCGEEAPLVPSHEVFFTGCNLRCKYCYSWQSVIDPQRGRLVCAEELADIVSARKNEGAVNLNLIGGEPTVNLLAILETIKCLDVSTAVVWNSNFYMSQECMQLLDSIVDLYVGDFRFGCDECARSIAGVKDYTEIAKRNFLFASKSADIIIRHLVIPGHIECCFKPIAEWVSHNIPDIPFNLMFQYTPFYEALDDMQLSCSLSDDEKQRAMEIAELYNLNIESWKIPLQDISDKYPAGAGDIETTITIRPDGKVCILHVHKELLDIVNALEHD